jgi:hypothetical protein
MDIVFDIPKEGRKMNILDKITDYLIETKYEDLPEDVVEVTRRQVLDRWA